MNCRAKARRGLSQVEVVMATLITGVVLVAALKSVGASISGQRRLAGQARGGMLANAMLEEIAAQHYEEPTGAGPLGTDGGESPTNRQTFDDVDDFHGWSASPPELADGMVLTELNNWDRTVTVEYVFANDFTTVSGANTGVKRVTVVVRQSGVERGRAVGVFVVGSRDIWER